MDATQARRWLTGSLLMIVCIVLVRAFDTGPNASLLIGWVGGVAAVFFHPDICLEERT